MTTTRTDPVTFEVVWHRLMDITEEMGIKYMRTSGSPVLVGAYDASTGITLPDGQLVAMGPYITTQAHVLGLIIRSVIDTRSTLLGIREGDMFICNDPYLGATHQPDVATVAPVFHSGELQGWVGSSGHWLDIGGPEPGGFNMNAATVFDEGLRMPPTRIVEDGAIREDLVQLIMTQIREPLAELDLRGQVVANNTGLQRLASLLDEHGPKTVSSVMHQAIDHVEDRIRARLRSLPDGQWREVQFLDHDGRRPNLRRIVCTVTKRGDHLSIDFTGSDPESDGYANCTRSGLRAAVLSAVCIMLGFDLPWNDGAARCVNLTAPAKTVVTAEYPAPVSMSTISAIIVTLNTTFAALSKILLGSPLYEEAMATWCGTSIGPTIMGSNDRGFMTVCSEASHFAAGCGARTYADGVDTGGIIINTTANIPSIEATESQYPVLYLFRRQMRDSGGAGRFRGGVSGEVALVPYGASGPVESSFAGVGAATPNGFGLAGGLPGAAVRYLAVQENALEEAASRGTLPGRLDELEGPREFVPVNTSHRPFPADTVEYHNWQGGGGYGDPITRDPERVAVDVANGLVSGDVAAEVYGVVLDESGSIDAGRTAERREAMRGQRLQQWRPVREVLPGLVNDASAPPFHGERGSGVIDYGDLLVFDHEADATTCRACGERLGSVSEDYRLGCLVHVGDTAEAGPARGDDYRDSRLYLLLFCCPGCGRQLEAVVAMPTPPYPRMHFVPARTSSEQTVEAPT